MVVGELLQRVAGEAIDAAIADVEEMRGGRLDDHGAECADIAAVLVIGILAARLRMQPGIGGLQHALRRGAHRPGFRGAVIVGQESLDRRLRGNMRHRARADAVGQHDGNALEAEQRLVRDQDAVEILIGFLAAPIGKLSDGYLQLARHFPLSRRWALPVKRDPSASQDQAARREEAGCCEAGRFGAVLTWVEYSVSPVKARPPTRLPTTVGISFQKM